MRRRLLAAFLFALLGLVSCFGPQGPREVAEAYLTALAVPDFGSAMNFVAGDGQSNLEQLKKLHDTLTPEEQEKFRVQDWQVTGHQQMGDTAKVDFLFDKVKIGQLVLKNYAGTWKVVSRRTL